MNTNSNTNSQESGDTDLELDNLLRELAGIELVLRHERYTAAPEDKLNRVLYVKRQKKFEEIRRLIYGFDF